MTSWRTSYEFDSAPTPEEAEKLVKRMSTGANLPDQGPGHSQTKDEKVLKIATYSLQNYLKEPDFAAEFLERGGLESLCEIIKNTTGNTLAYALNSFTSLMEHDSGWDNLTDDFVADIAHIVVNEALVTICRPATAVLIKIVCADRTSYSSIDCYGYPTIHKAIERETKLLSTLVQRLQSPDYGLCLNSLALLTAMLKHVTEDHQSELSDAIEQLNARKSILRLMNDHPSEDLKEHLLEFQSALIQNAHKRRRTPVSMSNSHHAKMLNDIWEAANVKEVVVPGARKWKKLGFSTEVPQREFGRMGLFGLERMHGFAMKNENLFAKMILEQIHRSEGKRCPFAKASIEVTDLLCGYWNINAGYIAAEFEQPLLNFDHIHGTTLQCFYRIFHDMEATSADFSKVSALVRSQLRSVLKSEGIKDIYEFDRIMLGTPYQVIRDRRLKELEWADDLLGREAIRNLRTRLNKQSYEFIKKQRISCLLVGAWFPCPLSAQRLASVSGSIAPNAANAGNQTGANSPLGIMGPALGSGSTSTSIGKRWRYYKLSPSKKSLQYGDFAEKNTFAFRSCEKLPNKIDLSMVTEIKSLRKQSNASVVSHPSQMMSISDNASLSFGLYTAKAVAPLAEFICSSSAQASEWKDGLSMLLDKGITSKDTAEYLHALTEIGVKVKLLQIAGDRVEVPHSALEVPSVPSGLGSGFFYDTECT
ncbi:hypothetical protein DFQ28_009796 [Apophysomyces sp. BC1034]|nr:hypothetical protein DFQ30_009506 [Apophysomyces sp. BC1015]KAG0181621.1 hypothetical protein DFQ29_007725 [Apophysomyces sp. BC1021]KAG0192222.1 hypothetical protein DFQ28_009796 [Apophysomyces sp. BC1034]